MERGLCGVGCSVSVFMIGSALRFCVALCLGAEIASLRSQ
jgi:hypothetical protein